MPSTSSVAREKDYCDLLYAWLQCNSDRVNMNESARRIHKSKIKWTAIEKDFTRVLVDGSIEKVMSRKTIAKYFKHLEDRGFIQFNDVDDYYYLTVLDSSEANLIEYNTLSKLLNVMQRNSINIYVYLFNRFYANGNKPFQFTIEQIKNHIGISTTTRSNDEIVSNILFILQKLGIIKYSLTTLKQEGDNFNNVKTIHQLDWITNDIVKIKC